MDKYLEGCKEYKCIYIPRFSGCIKQCIRWGDGNADATGNVSTGYTDADIYDICVEYDKGLDEGNEVNTTLDFICAKGISTFHPSGWNDMRAITESEGNGRTLETRSSYEEHHNPVLVPIYLCIVGLLLILLIGIGATVGVLMQKSRMKEKKAEQQSCEIGVASVESLGTVDSQDDKKMDKLEV